MVAGDIASRLQALNTLPVDFATDARKLEASSSHGELAEAALSDDRGEEQSLCFCYSLCKLSIARSALKVCRFEAVWLERFWFLRQRSPPSPASDPIALSLTYLCEQEWWREAIWQSVRVQSLRLSLIRHRRSKHFFKSLLRLCPVLFTFVSFFQGFAFSLCSCSSTPALYILQTFRQVFSS